MSSTRALRCLAALALLVGSCSVARYGLDQQTLPPRGPLVGTSTHPPARDSSNEPDAQAIAEEETVAPVCALPETPESEVSARNARLTRPSDEEITRQLRVRLLSDPGLSSTARDVAITTCHGVVTVRGDISNVRERSQIQAHANALRGVTRVDNLLHVAE